MTFTAGNSSQQTPNFVLEQRPEGGSVAAPRDEQSGLTPNPEVGETQHLFDIDRLLEVVRLLEEIEKDTRLDSENKERISRVDTSTENL